MFQVSMQAQLAQKQSLVFTPQLQQAIKLLLLNNVDLTSYVEKAAEENPFLDVKLPEVTRGIPMLPVSSGRVADQSGYDPIAMLVDKSGDTFGAQVFAQVDDLLSDHAERAIGYALASHLEPTGWLLVALEDVAAKLGARRKGWNVQQADRRCKRLTNKTSRCVVGHIVMPPMRSAANWKRAGVQAGSLLAL